MLNAESSASGFKQRSINLRRLGHLSPQCLVVHPQAISSMREARMSPTCGRATQHNLDPKSSAKLLRFATLMLQAEGAGGSAYDAHRLSVAQLEDRLDH